MFNPHEAKEDLYGLVLALIVLFALLAFYVIWTVAPGGAKYWLLTADGQEVTADIVDERIVKPGEGRPIGETFMRNTDLFKYHLLVTYAFQGTAGDRHSGTAYLPVDSAESKTGSLVVLFWRRNPDVSLPLSEQRRFRLDGFILAGALVGLVALALTAVVTLRSWREFRRMKSVY